MRMEGLGYHPLLVRGLALQQRWLEISQDKDCERLTKSLKRRWINFNNIFLKSSDFRG